MNAVKTAGMVILGLAGFVAFIFAVVLLIHGTLFVAEKVLPYLITATTIATAICIFVFLPLALFRATRPASVWGFYLASFIFGLGVWMYGFLVTYDLWGGTGIFVGLILGVVGVVPLGILAAALHGIWYYAAELIYGLFLTFGARTFALYLMRKIERDTTRNATTNAI